MPGLAPDEPEPEAAGTLDEMLDVYLDAVREVQPEGPYHLVGWSFGGRLAQHLAARLRSQGDEVGLLVLLDAYPTQESALAGVAAGDAMWRGFLDANGIAAPDDVELDVVGCSDPVGVEEPAPHGVTRGDPGQGRLLGRVGVQEDEQTDLVTLRPQPRGEVLRETTAEGPADEVVRPLGLDLADGVEVDVEHLVERAGGLGLGLVRGEARHLEADDRAPALEVPEQRPVLPLTPVAGCTTKTGAPVPSARSGRIVRRLSVMSTSPVPDSAARAATVGAWNSAWTGSEVPRAEFTAAMVGWATKECPPSSKNESSAVTPVTSSTLS